MGGGLHLRGSFLLCQQFKLPHLSERCGAGPGAALQKGIPSVQELEREFCHVLVPLAGPGAASLIVRRADVYCGLDKPAAVD